MRDMHLFSATASSRMSLFKETRPWPETEVDRYRTVCPQPCVRWGLVTVLLQVMVELGPHISAVVMAYRDFQSPSLENRFCKKLRDSRQNLWGFVVPLMWNWHFPRGWSASHCVSGSEGCVPLPCVVPGQDHCYPLPTEKGVLLGVSNNHTARFEYGSMEFWNLQSSPVPTLPLDLG